MATDRSDPRAIYLLLALSIWLAHFSQAGDLGLYEDDYMLVGDAIAKPLPELVHKIEFMLRGFVLGRPLWTIAGHLFSALGKLGGLPALYALGYAIVTLNAILFFRLLQRLSANPAFAIVGALTLGLFPACTTRPYLTHTLGIELALTFCLLAFRLHVDRRPVGAYLLILCSLLTYEPFFLIFLVAPLLGPTPRKRLPTELARHGLVLAAMLAPYTALRAVTGDPRVADLDIANIVFTPLRQMAIGPLTSLRQLLTGPWLSLPGWDREQLLLSGIALVTMFFVLAHRLRAAQQDEPDSPPDLRRLAVAGAAMLVLSYPLFFPIAADTINGRDTRVHFPGALGAALLTAAVAAALSRTLFERRRRAFALVLAIVFSTSVGSAIAVQYDYRDAWQRQRDFWTQVVELCPDLDEGTVILAEMEYSKSPGQILALGWSVPLVLEQIYFFPREWVWPLNPRLYRLRQDWRDHVQEDGQLQLDGRIVGYAFPWEPTRTEPSDTIIFLYERNGELFRREDQITIGNQVYPIKTRSTLAEPPRHIKGYLYDLIVKPRPVRQGDDSG